MKSKCLQCGKQVAHLSGERPFCSVGCNADHAEWTSLLEDRDRLTARAEKAEARVRDLETFVKLREWTPHDERRDYCLACGGTRPEPDDDPPTIGHIRGCPAAALIGSCAS